MAKGNKKPKIGTLIWCIQRAKLYGVSYGTYIADYFEKDLIKVRKGKRRCCKQSLKD